QVRAGVSLGAGRGGDGAGAARRPAGAGGTRRGGRIAAGKSRRGRQARCVSQEIIGGGRKRGGTEMPPFSCRRPASEWAGMRPGIPSYGRRGLFRRSELT